MNALKKTSATLIAFALSASAFAGSDLETRVHELEKKIDMMSTTTAAGTFGPTLASARAEPNGMGWFLTFDVLYWQSKVGGADYVTSISKDTSTAIAFNGGNREPQFDWTFAFKAGIGYNFCHDGWDTHFEYTYFRNRANDSVSVSFPAALIPLDPRTLKITAQNVASALSGGGAELANQASDSLKLNFNDINWDLGRDFFVSKNLSLRPSAGLKASWITLKDSMSFTGGGTYYTNTVGQVSYTENGLGSGVIYTSAESKFIGIGPRGSMDTKWHLGNDISIYGNLAGALLFGYFQTSEDTSYSAYTANSVDFDSKFHRLVPTVDFELGIMYEKFMMCDSQYFAISLGYETQYFWDVNYLRGISPGGVGMYGVNLDFCWGF